MDALRNELLKKKSKNTKLSNETKKNQNPLLGFSNKAKNNQKLKSNAYRIEQKVLRTTKSKNQDTKKPKFSETGNSNLISSELITNSPKSLKERINHVRIEFKRLGNPVILFGESIEDQELRLRNLKLKSVDVKEKSKGQRDDFGSIFKDTDTKLQEEQLRRDWIGVIASSELQEDIRKALMQNNKSKADSLIDYSTNFNQEKDDSKEDEIVLYLLKRAFINAKNSDTLIERSLELIKKSNTSTTDNINSNNNKVKHPLLDDDTFMLSTKFSETIISSNPDSNEYIYEYLKSFYSVWQLTPSKYKEDPNFTQDLLIVFFKRMLRKWIQKLENDLSKYQNNSNNNNTGFPINSSSESILSIKKKIAIQRQSQVNILPLLEHLKNRSLEKDVIQKLVEICYLVICREYMQANDVYLRLSVGNAPWPIGVTMVGIHERSAREKISASHVAHALNDEEQRKWIQGMKRIMTFSQNEWPSSDLSKMVG